MVGSGAISHHPGAKDNLVSHRPNGELSPLSNPLKVRPASVSYSDSKTKGYNICTMPVGIG